MGRIHYTHILLNRSIELFKCTSKKKAYGKILNRRSRQKHEKHSLNKQTWQERVNPIIRGKVNYFLTLYYTVEENKRHGQESHCFINACKNQLFDIDGYMRRRLRVAVIHDNPSQRKGYARTTKWNNEFFVKIGLIPSFWLYYEAQYGYTSKDEGTRTRIIQV